jgi:hypothetical protein
MHTRLSRDFLEGLLVPLRELLVHGSSCVGGSDRHEWWLERRVMSFDVDTRANFGFTTPLWDYVFGTARVVDRVAVPARSAAGGVVATPGVEVIERRL